MAGGAEADRRFEGSLRERFRAESGGSAFLRASRARAAGEARRRVRRWRRLFGAAGVAAGVAAAAILLTGGPPPDARPEILWAWGTVGGDAAGERLGIGGRCRTGPEGEVALRFPDGTFLKVGAESDLRLESVAPKRLEVARGILEAEVVPQPREAPLAIRTPRDEVMVLGTRLRLVVESSRTRLEIGQGRARLRRLSDRHTVEVTSGFGAEAPAEGEIRIVPLAEGPCPGQGAGGGGDSGLSAPDRVGPADKPALPREIDPFRPPPVSGKISPDGPALAEWTRTAEPGDIVVVTGHKLTALGGKEAGRDAEWLVYGQAASSSGGPLRAEVVRAGEAGAALRIPPGLPSHAMLLLWVRNSFGLSRPAVINRTEGWWVGPDRATRGQAVGVYGRNLVKNPALAETAAPAGTSKAPPRTFSGSWIYLKPPAGSGAWIKPVSGNPYRVEFTIPATVPNGEYEVWIHNGRGGEYGWSGPLRLTVEDGPAWTGPTVNVRDHGAVGNGTADDTAAIQKALNAARRPGGTLLFPPGTYLLRQGLPAASNLRWMGAGRDKTILRASPDFPPGEALLSGNQVRHFEVRDLTLEAAVGKQYTSAVNIRHSTGLWFVNVRVHNPTRNAFDLQGGRYVFLQNVETVCNGNFLGQASQVFLEGCAFLQTCDANAALHSWGGSCLSITRCTSRDYDNTRPEGWGDGRFFVCMAHWGANRHQYFAENTTVDLCVRPERPDQNCGEQYLWEIGTKWQGRPAAATADTVTFGAGTPSLAGLELAVVRGRGLGQNRRVASFDAATGTATVAPPWNVVPGPDSLVAAGGFVDRVVLYRNRIDGKPRGVTSPTHIASAGIQPYGGTFNLVADGNVCHELRTGVSNWGMVGSGLAIPTYFCLYVQNRIEKCRSGISNFLGIWDSPREAGTALLMGVQFRRNTLVEVGTPLEVSRGKGDPAAMSLNVFDQNVIDGRPMPLRVD